MKKLGIGIVAVMALLMVFALGAWAIPAGPSESANDGFYLWADPVCQITYDATGTFKMGYGDYGIKSERVSETRWSCGTGNSGS